MVSLFDVIEDLMVLWIVLGIALIGLVAWLCYRFIPGLRIEKEEVDEKIIDVSIDLSDYFTKT